MLRTMHIKMFTEVLVLGLVNVFAPKNDVMLVTNMIKGLNYKLRVKLYL